jgi:hypothetical protein
LVVIGWILSLAGGHIFVGYGYCWLRHYINRRPWDSRRLCRCAWFGFDEENGDLRSIPVGLTGALERIVFTTAAMVSPANAPTLMGGWLVLKLASNWQRDLPAMNERQARTEAMERRSNGFAALLAGLVSMFLAWLGGFIASQGVNL